ncbi:MAG: GtrA family protein [Clostridium sp.]|nr:GtrA family protein [Prevotella sp.]MCM1428441.1 GtrA family protein [Clostridium sp.]MCM1474906.1 GtrA family protein [Muribaculaceae bacterium]
MKKLNKVGDNLLHNDNFIFTFLRSAVSSQASGWTDTAVSFIFFSLVGLTPFLSTALGAVAGGIVNCIINYRFTFHAEGCDWRAVVVKYALVWVGSLLLNSFGTQFLYYLINDWDWLETIGFKKDGFFLAARLFVALIVSWAWNFLLQRYFVYRVNPFDKYAIRFVDLFGFGHTYKKNK